MSDEKNVSAEENIEIDQETAAADETVTEEIPETDAEEARTADAAEAEEQSESGAAEDAETPAEETETPEAPAEDAEAPEGSGQGEEAPDTKTDGKKRFFGRKEKKELEKKDAEIAEITDRYKRTLAEYDNFRRRTEKEKADLYAFAVRDVMTKLLPVLDNLERGVAAVPEDKKDDAIAQGMDKILKQFQKALDDVGVKPIEAEGKPFDPNFHNAVMHIDDENLSENIVAEEFQKGYTYRDSVVRHSMVKVAN